MNENRRIFFSVARGESLAHEDVWGGWRVVIVRSFCGTRRRFVAVRIFCSAQRGCDRGISMAPHPLSCFFSTNGSHFDAAPLSCSRHELKLCSPTVRGIREN